jgi:LmbE family N-acetylglucosaminyl deacetylase
MRNPLSLLAVFAHPDDESCGPGATLAMYARQGVELTLVCVTRGEAGFCDDLRCEDYRATSREQFASIRLQELEGACKALGIRRWAVLGYPDGGGAYWDRRTLEGELVRWVRTVRPHVVVTCYPEGEAGHPDHDTVARATTKAYLGAGYARRFPEHLAEGLAPWQPRKLYYCLPPDPEVAARIKLRSPLTNLDVSPHVQDKIRAMQCHGSQKQCSQEFAEAVGNSPHWTESFCLAHSRVSSPESTEDGLFAGVQAPTSLGTS